MEYFTESSTESETPPEDYLIHPIRISLFRRRIADEDDYVEVDSDSGDERDENYEDELVDVENVVDVPEDGDEPEDIDVDVEATDEETVDVESNIAQAPNVILSPESPEPGVENPIVRLENPHFNKDKKVNSSQKRSFQEMQDDDTGQNCPVCLDAWTSVGSHRLCSLKCGHLFGKSCVLRWLSLKKKAACPQCNSKTRKADIRDIYANKLVALDNSELEELRGMYAKAVEDKRELENLLAIQKEMTEHFRKLAEPSAISTVPAITTSVQMIFYKTLVTLKLEENSCRVLAYSPQRNIIVLSQKSPHVLFPGFGLRLLSPVDWTLSPYYPLHKKMIRDLAFHPDNTEQLLSVAFDNSVKLFDVISRTELVSITTENPSWCCSWDKTVPRTFYCGSGKGDVFAYNMDCPSECKKLEEGEGVPVIAVVRSSLYGFILCCRLNSVTAFVKDQTSKWRRQTLQVCSGPFVAMSYDDSKGILVLACRPTEEFHLSFRHASYRVTFTNGVISCEDSHVFLAGHSLTRIARPCLLSLADKSYYFAFNESQSEIWGWCLDNSSKVLTMQVNKPVTDLLAVTRDKDIFLMVLTTGYIKCFSLS